MTIQEQIKALPDTEKSQISDGYHTFNELYEHRYVLWICLLNTLNSINLDSYLKIFKTQKHHDGTQWDGWFLSCLIFNEQQISYHLPMKYWDKIEGEAFEQSPYQFDGHSSDDVLERLKNLCFIRNLL